MYQNIFFDKDKNEIHLWDDTTGYEVFKYKRYAYIEDSNGQFVGVNGKRLKRTGRWSEQDMQDGVVHEGDINPEMRILVDRYLESDEISTNHRVMVLDIEVSMENGKPNIETAQNHITAISFYTSHDDKYTALILDTESKIKTSQKDNVEVISCKTEESLLSRFISLYDGIGPTILTGWNIDYFDVPYLFHRLQRILGSDAACMLSPIGIVKYLSYRERYRLAGVSCLDYLALYKKLTFSQEPSYNLDAISIKELGFGKTKYEGTLDTLFETDIEKFLEYNINDVKLVKLMEDKLKFIETAQNICHKGHVPYEDVYYSSKFLEGAMLVYMKKLDMIAPSNMNRDKEHSGEKYEGAYVKPPIPGKYDWVYDLDMTSLYPSVIMSLNISPETKIGKIEGWDAQEFIKNVEKTYTLHVGNKESKIDEKQLRKLLDDGKFSISSNGVLYDIKKKGIIPAILETWFAERVEYKNLMKKYGDSGNKKMYEYFKARQYVQKVLLNSFYGVLGLPVYRFYDVDNAEATTLTGQEIIKYSQRMANYFYNKELGTNEDYVIYIDTDSNYISALPLIIHRHHDVNTTNEDVMSLHVINIATEVQNFINKSFDLFSQKFLNVEKHQFNIKQEMVAKSGVFLGKKRYALLAINDNGVHINKLEVKGIDTVRSDFPPAFRSLLSEILKDILDGKEKSIVDEKLLTFKKNIRILSLNDVAKPTSVQNISNYTAKSKSHKHVSTSDFGFKNYLKGTPAHVKAAIMYNNLLKYYKLSDKYSEVEDSDKVRWVYLTQNEFDMEAIAYKGYEDPPQIMDFINKHINHEKMFDSIFSEKLIDLYSALKWTLPSENEKKMNEFFEL